MGSTEFQKEYITYLEDENNKLKNKVSEIKENLEKVLTNSTKNELEYLVYDVMKVCCAMTDEIDEFYEHFSATSAALCSVLRRKSQMMQLSKKLSTLLPSVEQIDPELELIDANNMACFAKRLSDGKSSNQKRRTAKVSPTINGLTILTDPKIRLNRVTHEIANRHRINPEPPQLSPVVEVSPATTPPRNRQQMFFREIQISVPRLNINADGQVVNRNNEESPRSSNCVKKRKKPPTVRLSQGSSSNRRVSEPPTKPEEENEESATEEEKENLNNSRNSNGEEVLRLVPAGENSAVEEDKEEEECSHSSATESSPESSKGKNNSLSSPEESVDPLEGPSWLLDDRQSRRESGKASNFKFVNVRRQRNQFFSGSSKDDSVEDPVLNPVVKQNPDKNDEKEKENSEEKKIDLLAHDNLDTSDMEMTECLPVVRHDVNNQINKILPSQGKVATPITESSAEIDSSFAKSEASLDVSQRKRIEESIEEEEEQEEDKITTPTTCGSDGSKLRNISNNSDVTNNFSLESTEEDDEEEEDNITTAATYGSDGSKLRNISNNSDGTDNFNNIHDRTLKVVLEKRESLALMARSESVKSLPSPKNHTKDRCSSETKIIDFKKVKNNVNSDRSSSHSPEKVEKAGSNYSTPVAPENTGRPKREAAKRCLEQKVWILGTPEDDRNKNKNKNKNFKTKRKQGDESNSSPNDKRKKHQNQKNDKENESNVDSDTSTQDSVPTSPLPQNHVKSAKTPNVENNRSVDQSLGGSASILPEEETKKKRKFKPASSKFSTFDETNRTIDQSNVNNGSSIPVEEEGRRKRRAAPVSLKEPSLNQKMRRNP